MSQNPHFILVTGDFNVRLSLLWKNDLMYSDIDLIFINQNNFIMDSGVHASLNPNCHHQIVYAKLNLKIEYPPLYERLVWDYK